MTVAASALFGAGLASVVVAGVFVDIVPAGVVPSSAVPRRDEMPVGSRAASPGPDAETTLDSRRLLFRENEDRARVVAEVTATLVRVGDPVSGDVRLRIVASAVGSSVTSAPGWESVRGVNRITAEEMGALLAAGGLAIESSKWVLGKEASERTLGSVVESDRGPLLERTLDARGVVRHEPTRDAYARGVTFLSAPLPLGTADVKVLASGWVRIRAIVTDRGGAPRIAALDGFGPDGRLVERP